MLLSRTTSFHHTPRHAFTHHALMVIALAFLLLPASSSAQMVQRTANTEDCVMFNPSSNSDGDFVAFESACDLTGGNADGNREIFVESGGVVTQLTDSIGCSNASPSINAEGDIVAFDSDCDYIAENADESFEIFTVSQGAFEQLTDGEFCSSLAPSIDSAGVFIAFDSDCDFLLTNIDRSSEIYRVSAQGGVTQLTADDTGSGCSSFNASTNDAGDLIAFESDCDLVGENHDQVGEIFQVTAQGVVQQLTRSLVDTCMSASPSSDAAGSLVAFESDCDYAGGNGDGGLEIFRVSSAGVTEQLTDHDGGSSCESGRPSISGDGAAVWFGSFCNLTGSNADMSLEVYRVSDADGIEQITLGAATCSSFAVDAYADGKHAIFGSDCDHTGDNPDRSDEIFDVSLCFCGAPFSRYASSQNPVASDALFTLQAAVGLDSCGLCDCDVDGSGGVAASDALRILQAATGQPIPLDCT